MNPFRILWKSLADVYDNLFVAVGMNVVWLVLSIPAIPLIDIVLNRVLGLAPDPAFVIAAFLALLFPGPGSIGIHNFMNQLFKEERVEFSLYWAGLRQLWWRALLLFLLVLVVDALLFVNITFYWSLEAPIKYVAIIWVYGFILWTMMGLYMNPLLVEQSDKRFVLIVRNSFLLCLDNAVPTLIILIMLSLISVLSIGIVILVALVTGSYVAAVETRAVLSFLEKIRLRAAKATQ
jgi:uncharacterized membrane protein YesL